MLWKRSDGDAREMAPAMPKALCRAVDAREVCQLHATPHGPGGNASVPKD